MKQRKKLIGFRKQKNWSQKDVVTELKLKFGYVISVSYYGMIEQGVRNPRLDLGLAIAALFDADANEIFFGNQNNKMLGKSDELQPTGTEGA